MSELASESSKQSANANTEHERSRRVRVIDEVLADLDAEGERLRATVAELPEPGWRTETAAEGWDIAAQIVHLAWTDEAAILAVRASRGDSGDWDALLQRGSRDPEHFTDHEAASGARQSPAVILKRWDDARHELRGALSTATDKLPWFGPPMSPASMATARLMETWAHGLDVYQALGIEPVVTDAIGHICRLGVRTRDFAYLIRGLTPPTQEFRVELTAPGGTQWTWGPAEAEQRVTGPAYDFARLATQRIHLQDTALTATGPDAAYWLTIAQAFAGPPGPGRTPRAERGDRA